MNRIVLEHYPASKLPDDIRKDVDPRAMVTVVVTVEQARLGPAMSLEELFALRTPPFRTPQEIDDDLRRERDSWDD